jgi:hypothetical protein
LVEICVGDTLSILNFKIQSVKCIKLAQKTPVAKISGLKLTRVRL